MSKKSAFNRAPKFKPEVKAVNNRPKQSATMTARKEKIEVLSEPIKSISDKKLYKTIRLENGLTALLISDPSKPHQNDENSSSEDESSGSDESGSEVESDSEKSTQSEASDQHGTKRHAEFDEEKLSRTTTPRAGPKWSLNRLDKDILLEAAIVASWAPLSSEDVEEWLNEAMDSVCDASMPRIGPYRPRRQTYWWCPEIRILHRECVAARRRFTRYRRRRNRDQDEEDNIYQAYRTARHALRDSIRQAKSEAWEEWLATLERDPWGRPYKWVRQKLRPAAPPLTQNLDPELRQLIVSTLFPPRTDWSPLIMAPPVEDPNEIEEVPPVTSAELAAAVTKMSLKNTAMKQPEPQVLATLTNCLVRGRVPRRWKTGKLVLLRKNGRPAEQPSAYRPIVLLDKAACALCVGVGSYSDPPDIQGLAHFVEHMVFMGSEKYPKENEFDAFIKKKGGSDNASTDCEVTTYYFEIQEKHLAQAMDIFSQFFVSPLMLKEAMQREREAIESEFSIAAPSDSNRKDQLLSSLFPEGHPARIFTWGNIKSLKDDVQDDEKLYKAAHDFRKRHYSAHRMTLAVQARMDLASLEQYVVSTFGQIPSNRLPPDDFSRHAYAPGAVTPDFRSMYYVKPISDTTEVHLTWCMRSLIAEYESKPHQYISHLLGHEGRGSLLSYLRKKVWALGIYTGNSESGIDYTSMYSLFSAQVVLTKDGLDHIDEVLEAVFSYINMLRKLGPSEQIYEEIKAIEETSFRFSEESQPAEYVETLAENMHFFPPEHYITGDKLYYKYDPKGITELLDCMRADSVNIMILSNKHTVPVQYDAKERWFGTEYKKEEIPKPWLERWLNVDPYTQFHLPEKNIYITTNFDLVPPAPAYIEEAERLGLDLEKSSPKDVYKKVEASPRTNKIMKQGDLIATVNNFRLDQPNLLRKNRHMELWYKPDFKFRFPTALLYFYFITPLSLKSPRDSCLIDLWTDVLQQGLKEDVYPANMADLSHSLFVSDKGLTLKVSGYNQNLHLVVDLISRGMRTSTEQLTPELFEAVRDVRARSYHNLLLKPHKLAKDLRMNVLLEPYISPRDKAMSIQNITLAELKDYTGRLLDKLYLQVLIQGNIAWHDAIKISDNVLHTIKWEGLAESELPDTRVHELPLGARRVRVRSLNPSSTNSIVANYYQGEPATDRDSAVVEVLMMLMEEPVFDALRTKEQLGYSVFSLMRYTFGVLGYSVSVNTQVHKFSVSHVDARVEAFLERFARDMRRLKPRALAAAVHALVQLKHTADYELKEEVERHWREITNGEYRFQRLFTEADAIENVTLSDLKSWVENHFATGNKSQFRKLSVQVIGNQQNETSTDEEVKVKNYTLQYYDGSEDGEADDTFVRDLNEFKRNLPLLVVPKVELPQC